MTLNDGDGCTFFIVNPPLRSIRHIVDRETAWPQVTDNIS
jgi:hypothetical protein